MSILRTLTINGTKYDVVPVVPASTITLLADAWVSSGEEHSQVVNIPDITANTKIDLQPTSAQLAEFHYKVLAFVAENEGGKVTVYAIGDKPKNDHTIQITKTEVEGTGKIRGNTVGTTMPRPDWNQTDPTKADYIKNKPENLGGLTEEDKAALVEAVLSTEDILEMQQTIAEIRADLDYVNIDVTKFTNSAAGTYEMGSKVTTVNLTWELNKTPASQTLDGATIANDVRSKEYTGLNITSNKTYTLNVTDERGATDSASSSISFVNGVYYGSMAHGTTINSAAILGLTRKLQSGKAVNFTVTSDRPVYALPTRYGTPIFKIGGFEYEWEKISTFSFTNQSGYAESYDVWMHTQDVSGSVTVNVT